MRTPLLVLWLLATAICASSPAVFGQPAASRQDEPESVSTYIEQLASPDQRTRLQAVDAIGSLGPQAKAAVPKLIVMLNGTDPSERMAAAMALAKMGHDAEPALPALRQAAATGDERLKRIARLAIEAIDPPVSTRAMAYAQSPYVLAGIMSIGAGAIVLLVLVKRRGSGKIPEPVWKEEQTKAQQARAEKVKADTAEADRKAEAQAQAKAKAPPAPSIASPPPAAPAAAKSAGSADRVPRHRARVSRPLLGLGNYLQEQEGPETSRRALTRAQDELKKLSDLQKDLTELLEKDDIKRDPERMRSLRKDIDEYAIEHYRAEVRVKALEIKLIEALLGDGKTSDAELLERTETTLKEKWDDLRTLCETPAKIVFKAGEWTSVTIGPTTPIPDLRERLRDFDVFLPERNPEESTSA